MAPIERVEILHVNLPPKVKRTDAIQSLGGVLEYIPQLDDVTMSRMIMRDGYAVPPTAPGLGIDWDFAAVERLAVARAAIGPA